MRLALVTLIALLCAGAAAAHGGNATGAGFVNATGLLHLAGLAFGLLAARPAVRIAVRTAGGAIAFGGLGFLSCAL